MAERIKNVFNLAFIFILFSLALCVSMNSHAVESSTSPLNIVSADGIEILLSGLLLFLFRLKSPIF